MRLFRPALDVSLARPRQPVPADVAALSRLFRVSTHQFLSLPADELPELLINAPATLLVAPGGVWAAALGGRPIDSTVWLRGLALADGLGVGAGLDALLPPFYALLRAQGARSLFYAGSEQADRWLQPALRARGYARETDVVGYEKRAMNAPTQGDRRVLVRPATSADIPAVLEVDRASFADQWRKDEGIIGPAIVTGPYFVLAELAGTVAGYAFATRHFDGRLVHLVRIAVSPPYRRQGIGARLLAEVVSYARSCGAENLTLNTQVENTQAQLLYEWFGFRRTSERQTVLRLDLVAWNSLGAPGDPG